MSGQASRGLSRGFLPVTALHDRGPTAVGQIDLGQAIGPRAPGGGPLAAEGRDSLLLIRMHDDPLAVVHIERDVTAMDPEELASEIWRLVGAEARRHCARSGCIQTPIGAEEWTARLQAAGACSSAESPAAPGSGAVVLSTVGQDPGQLKRCLRSLLNQRRRELEIVVVDNRPANGRARRVVEVIAESDPRVRYVPERRPGLSVARNRGLVETDAEFVAFTDDDVVVDPTWLEWLLAPFADPTVAVACGMVLPLALETDAQKRFERYLGFSRGVERKVHDLRSGRAEGLPFYPFLADVFGSGNSMAFRRTHLLLAGGFDPALGAGSPARAGEETDVFSRAILDGHRIVYEPRALSWHEHRRDSDALRDQIFGYGVGVGALIMKAASSDVRFYRATALRFAQLFGGRGKAGSRPGERELPPDLAALLRARRAGIARGPLRYAQGVAQARRLGFYRMKREEDPASREEAGTR
jgi:GT2 family glycosyltransferase